MELLAGLCNVPKDAIDADSAQIPNASIPSLDSTLKPAAESMTFPLFSWLPKELRLKIWEEVTPRERVVHVYIRVCRDENNEVVEAPVRYLEKNHLGNPVSGSLYWLLVDDHRLDHPLLAVNREARQVVMDFYRIQIPCPRALSRGSHANRQQNDRQVKTFFFNPEHDVLQVRAEEPVNRTLIDFLWDLKAYDPKGVGLLKMATDIKTFCENDLRFLKRSDLLLIRQRQALVETLSQLQEVWFINTEPAKNGFVMGQGSLRGSPPTYPSGCKPVEFESIGLDTREGAESALQSVYVGIIDPRELIWRWKKLLRTWEIHHARGQVRYRVIVAQRQFSSEYGKNGGSITRKMRELSLGPSDQVGKHLRSQSCACQYCTCEVSGPSLRDHAGPEGPKSSGSTIAPVGFWSFPTEALGEIGEGETLSDMDFQHNRFLDMRNYWPELLVANVA
ncbi:hypothetical protein KVR01_010230 [Diaporthe batatas]|uniref:uncharacterized protein n=1 Tax=Diaporthe batatas TaxID=748121 RepID=UPI001D04D1BE|nr:uncharacterized protein KVR01_010230 [Diaporthe batatas]KAG8159593.1 hypothetical protein KVR01_010230 [Diaporthe batatas]